MSCLRTHEFSIKGQTTITIE